MFCYKFCWLMNHIWKMVTLEKNTVFIWHIEAWLAGIRRLLFSGTMFSKWLKMSPLLSSEKSKQRPLKRGEYQAGCGGMRRGGVGGTLLEDRWVSGRCCRLLINWGEPELGSLSMQLQYHPASRVESLHNPRKVMAHGYRTFSRDQTQRGIKAWN